MTLSSDDEAKVKSVLPSSKGKIYAIARAKCTRYFAGPQPDERRRVPRLYGAIALVLDHTQNVIYLRLVDLDGARGVLWEYRLENSSDYTDSEDGSLSHMITDAYGSVRIVFTTEDEERKFLGAVRDARRGSPDINRLKPNFLRKGAARDDDIKYSMVSTPNSVSSKEIELDYVHLERRTARSPTRRPLGSTSHLDRDKRLPTSAVLSYRSPARLASAPPASSTPATTRSTPQALSRIATTASESHARTPIDVSLPSPLVLNSRGHSITPRSRVPRSLNPSTSPRLSSLGQNSARTHEARYQRNKTPSRTPPQDSPSMSPVRKRSISAWLRLLKFLRSSSTRPTSPQPSLPEQNSVSSRGPQHHRSQTPLSTPQASSSTSPSRTRSIASRPRASRPLQPSSTPPTSPQWHFTERDASSALETQRDRSKIQYTPLPSRPLSPARAHLIASRSLSHAQRLPQSLPIQHPSPQLPPLEQTSPRNASRKWGKLPYVHTVATSEALWANVQERHRLALDVLFGRITEAAERYRDQYIRLGEFEKFLSCQSGIDVLTNFTGDKATPYVELLDELIFLTDDANLRSRYLEILRKLCSTCGSFPKSFHISSGSLRKTGNRPEALGGFSDIWKGEYCGREVAIKVLRGYDSGEASCEDIQALVKEVLVWKHLKHKNITPFIGLDTDLFRLSLVCTWMPYGTIKAYLQAHPTSNRLVLLLHVAEGLRYLHEMNVLHGDLKSANILINEHHVACLADFGLTTLCHQGKLTTLSVTACSPRWTAPEILDPERFGLMRAQSTVASDVYSFAMVAWEVFTGLLPFHDCSHIGSISWRIQTGVRPERPTADALELGLTDEVWDLMEQCWQAEPRVRPGVDEIQACLEEAVTDATSDLPTIPPQRSRAPSRRNRKNPLLSDLVAIGDEVWPPPEEDTFPEDML